ncbi:DUF4145 domain-containing protein [Mesorhizobium australicum]|uniref:DUF4145 domain-containing protein n=1 Tax=Mesorhizobium australicum TaxID=536018 RepID=UPI003336765B
MDRSLWREKYPEDSYPAFPCPKCKNGLLKKVKDKSVTVWEESEDPMIAGGKFTSFFACSHAFCRTVAVLSGIASSGPYYYIDQDGEEQMDEETNFYPKSMIPGPRIITIPGKTPKAVRDEITKSFGLFWTDKSSAANKLRNAVEEILADFGIPKATPSGKFVALGIRLDRAEKLDIAHHGTMVALKDVGNTGSHEGALPLKDLLDAYDIFEDALEDIYGGRKARLDAIRARLTKPKPPAAPPSRKPATQVSKAKIRPPAKP